MCPTDSSRSGLSQPFAPDLDPDALLSKLDRYQRQVAEAVRGPVCVLAGAGTGKTRAMTYRIAYAVASRVVHPYNILAVTFTARAAAEMKTRLRDLGVPGVNVSTFHAAALAQLRYFWPRAVGGPMPRLIERTTSVVTAAASKLGLPVDIATVKDMASEISWARVCMIAPEKYPEEAEKAGRSTAVTSEDIVALMKAYEEEKSALGVIDFEDILLILVGMLLRREDIAAEIRRQYSYFVVDEYQDVSPLQHRLLSLWLGGRKDICVVGDVSQTIYSFAGARSSFLSGFTREFPGARVIELKRNYRSTPQIVAAANAVISVNQTDGAVFLEAASGSGRPVSVNSYPNDDAETAAVVARIQELTSTYSYSDIAILYRINSQSAVFEKALEEAGIPYQVRDQERFFARKEVRDVMVMLKAEARSVGARGVGTSKDDGAHRNLLAAVDEVLFRAGWRSEPPNGQAARARWETLRAVRALAEEANDRGSGIRAFVGELEERAASQHAPTINGVTLCSFHAAKGLEWPVVFLVGCSEGLLPISYATLPAEIAEERRLFYVGITRAQECLEVTWAESSGDGSRGRTRAPSDFLRELQEPAKAAGGGAAGGAGAGGASGASGATTSQAGSRIAAEIGESYEEFAAQHPEDCELYELICQWREGRAEELGLRPPMVISDATVRDIAVNKPISLAELARTRGIGTVRLSRYGLDLIGIVTAYLAQGGQSGTTGEA